MLERSPTDHRTGEIHERFMNLSTSIVPHTQPLELMQPTDRPLDRPAHLAKPAAVRRPATGNAGGNVPARQRHSMFITVVATIAHHTARLPQRRANLAADRRNRIHQWNQLRAVVPVRAGEDGHQRRAPGIAEDVVLRAGFAAVRGVGARFFPAPTARTVPECKRSMNGIFARRVILAMLSWYETTATD